MMYLVKARIALDKLTARLSREDGQGMVEYGLILALIAIVAIVGLKTLGPKISGMFDNVGSSL